MLPLLCLVWTQAFENTDLHHCILTRRAACDRSKWQIAHVGKHLDTCSNDVVSVSVEGGWGSKISV